MGILLDLLAIVGAAAVLVIAYWCGMGKLAAALVAASVGHWLSRKPVVLIGNKYYIVPEAAYREIIVLPKSGLPAAARTLMDIADQTPQGEKPSNVIILVPPGKKE